ncbi:Eukaryotic translation initiation factor 3 subunit K [Castilleja foliolosa]|uniref:Eukaryotic translation initiation factor 3 subunit K n=1 Tax=Castilleja foliolosa TaxID=1961234 RepID=A0ABD3BZ72_9LAMI
MKASASPNTFYLPRKAINIKGQSLDKLLEHHIANSGWEIEKDQSKGQLIILPRTEFNHSELKKSNADGIPLDKIARIIPILG